MTVGDAEAVVIHLAGTPAAQPRPRPARNHAGFVSTPTGPAKRWRAQVEAACRAWLSGNSRQGRERPAWLDQALTVDLVFWLATPRRERWGKPHTFKPDWDNLAKLPVDVAKKAGIIGEDARIATGRATKLWARAPGALMVLRPWAMPADLAGMIGGDDDLGAYA